MTTIQLERTDSKYILLQLPSTPAEFKISQKIPFDFEQLNIIAYLKKCDEEGKDLYRMRPGLALALARAISRGFNVDLSDLLNIHGNSLLEMNEADFYLHIDDLVSGMHRMDDNSFHQLQDNLMTVFNYINHVARKTDTKEPPTHITYNGEQYALPKAQKHPTSGRLMHNSITYQQATQIIQANNNYADWKKANADKHGTDEHAQWLYTTYLSEVAMLLNSPDVMPWEPQEFNVWMANQLIHFADIDWQTCYYLETWFNGSMAELRLDKRNAFFFESTYIADATDDSGLLEKAKRRSEYINSRTGIMHTLPVLIEMDVFTKPGEPKLKSIMRAPFSTCVQLISLNNARQAG